MIQENPFGPFYRSVTPPLFCYKLLLSQAGLPNASPPRSWSGVPYDAAVIQESLFSVWLLGLVLPRV